MYLKGKRTLSAFPLQEIRGGFRLLKKNKHKYAPTKRKPRHSKKHATDDVSDSRTDSGDRKSKRLRIYYDRSRELVDGTGESWEKSYTSSSVDEVLGYLADIKDGEQV